MPGDRQEATAPEQINLRIDDPTPSPGEVTIDYVDNRNNTFMFPLDALEAEGAVFNVVEVARDENSVTRRRLLETDECQHERVEAYSNGADMTRALITRMLDEGPETLGHYREGLRVCTREQLIELVAYAHLFTGMALQASDDPRELWTAICLHSAAHDADQD